MPTALNFIEVWSKVARQGDRLLERRYAVRIDGAVFTRLDSCDLQRHASSFITTGYEEFKFKVTNRPLTRKALITKIAKQLEPKGYRRLW